MLRVVTCVLLVVGLGLALEVPAGLRPAKAVGESEEKIVPATNEQPTAPSNARPPPNLSLRSRHVAAQNSPSESQDGEPNHSEAEFKEPVVFTKSKGAKKQEKAKPAFKPVEPAPSASKLPRVTGPPPPSGNYGVNTILQTNLVDSKGRIIKGVSSVPIRVPSTEELKNAKPSRATASQVETEADKVVPVEFGRSQPAI
ncbi:unnamed protein product [Bursaphelenchus xylophilus]|uniref:(pine wood nematode) hypothetical protein n=1 Tax=Bursaphelenchus xylophilus TaxID=6326 RepID=A0A1I7S528_BURXY|nr:unnamed protein product [Bursaphelenchus xylophilus]CAG9117636.1 unnamed protein product [Bursaphelenchus xylophilus]